LDFPEVNQIKDSRKLSGLQNRDALDSNSNWAFASNCQVGENQIHISGLPDSMVRVKN